MDFKLKSEAVVSSLIPEHLRTNYFQSRKLLKKRADYLQVKSILEDARAQLESPSAVVEKLSLIDSVAANQALHEFEITVLVVCCELLIADCSVLNWEFLWSLMWNWSFLYEQLPLALISIAPQNAQFKKKLSALAEKVIVSSSKSCTHVPIIRDQENLERYVKDWFNSPSLSDLFRGLPESDDTLQWDNSKAMARVLAGVDFDFFIDVIVNLKNPYAVKSALFDGGLAGKPNSLIRVLGRCPFSFSEAGFWNGNLLLPLVLYHFRNSLLYASKLNENSESKESIDQLVAALDHRSDGVMTSLHWGTWLVGRLIAESDGRAPSLTLSTFDSMQVQQDNEILKGLSAIVTKASSEIVSNWSSIFTALDSWTFICLVSFSSENVESSQHCEFSGVYEAIAQAFIDDWKISVRKGQEPPHKSAESVRFAKTCLCRKPLNIELSRRQSSRPTW